MTTQQNLMQNYLQVEQDLKGFLGEKIRHNSPRISIEKNISPEEFKDKYVLQNKPVILRGVLDKWPAMSKWDFDYFANLCGDAEVNVNLYDVKNTKRSNIKTLVKEMKKATIDAPVYLQEWWFQNICPDLLNDIVVPNYFTDDQNMKLLGFYNSTLWIGTKGAFTPLHQDSVFANIWTTQIRGKKEWILFNKNAVLNALKDGKADYEEFLANPENGVTYCLIEKGDVMYVPHKWWHRARTLEDSVSLNTFYITDEIVKRYLANIFAIPMAVALNKELLQNNDPMRYNICMARLDILSELLGYDKNNILKIRLQDNAKNIGSDTIKEWKAKIKS